jgi:hypothetical protein
MSASNLVLKAYTHDENADEPQIHDFAIGENSASPPVNVSKPSRVRQ